MFTALRSFMNGCLWAGVGFLVHCLLGVVWWSLGLIDYFAAGEPGEPMTATSISLIECGVLMATGFLWGIHRTYRRDTNSPPKTGTANMNADRHTSKLATIVFWLVAVSFVLGLALFKAIPKRAEAASSICFARMQALGSLVKAYAGKHQGRRPKTMDDFREVTPNMTSQAWTCPASARSHYRFAPPNIDDTGFQKEMIRCTIHGHVVSASGDAVRATKVPAELIKD